MFLSMPGIQALRKNYIENQKKEAEMLQAIHKQESAYDRFSENLYQIGLDANDRSDRVRCKKIHEKISLISTDKDVCAELVMGIDTLPVLTDLIHSISKIMSKANSEGRNLTAFEKSVVSHELTSLIEHEVVLLVSAEEGRTS